MANTKTNKTRSAQFLDGCLIERDFFLLSQRLDIQPYDEYDHGTLVWYDVGAWTFRDRNWQVDSVTVLRPPAGGQRAYVALEEGTGVVGTYWPGGKQADSLLPGAEDGHGLPSMTCVRQIGGALFACGYMGKVFRQRDGVWERYDQGLKTRDFGDFLKEGMSVPDALAAQEQSQRDLRCLGGWSPERMLCGGRRGLLFRHDGVQWHPMASPTNADINAIACVGDTAYLVGNAGIILHGTERGVTALQTGMDDNFQCVSAFAGQVYVGGERGVYRLEQGILHRLVTTERTEFPCVALDANEDQLLAVCERFLLVFDGKAWRRIDDPDNLP